LLVGAVRGWFSEHLMLERRHLILTLFQFWRHATKPVPRHDEVAPLLVYLDFAGLLLPLALVPRFCGEREDFDPRARG
jgi:hypothetical protein